MQQGRKALKEESGPPGYDQNAASSYYLEPFVAGINNAWVLTGPGRRKDRSCHTGFRPCISGDDRRTVCNPVEGVDQSGHFFEGAQKITGRRPHVVPMIKRLNAPSFTGFSQSPLPL